MNPSLQGLADQTNAIQAARGLNPAQDGFGTGPGFSAVTVPFNYQFNGTTWDRKRAHGAYTLLASASRTTTQVSADIVVYNERYLDLILDMTVVGTGSVTVLIEGKDPASGKYYTLLAGAAVITNSTNVYRIGPTLVAAANAVAQFALPRTIRITVTANNANAATYSVGYNLSV